MTTIEFQTNIDTLQAELFGLALKLSKEYNDAQDLVQESITKAFKNKHRFETGSNFRAWMSTILYNEFINVYRKRKRRGKIVVSEEVGLPVVINKSSKEQAESNLLLQELEQIVNGIKEELRTPFKMYNAGYSYKEIGKELGIAIGTIKSRIFYARKELQQKIKQIYGSHPLKMAA